MGFRSRIPSSTSSFRRAERCCAKLNYRGAWALADPLGRKFEEDWVRIPDAEVSRFDGSRLRRLGISHLSLPSTRAFRQHSRNLASAEHGLLMVERAHKAAIRRNHEDEIAFQARMHELVVGIVAEARLRKIVWDPAGFNERERNLIRVGRSQLARWELAVEYAFRRHYVISVHLELASLSQPQRDQAMRLQSMLATDLRPIIESSNDLAHGFWEWHMNSQETAIIGAATAPLNYLQLHRRSSALAELAGLIHALAISEPTFQRDYDRHVKAIDSLSQGFAAADSCLGANAREEAIVGQNQPSPRHHAWKISIVRFETLTRTDLTSKP